MAVNRFVLNNISYHGAGAIKEKPGEIKRRGYGKALVCSDPDLVSFSVTAKATDELDAEGIAWSLYGQIKLNPTFKTSKMVLRPLKRPGRYDLSNWRRLFYGYR